MNVAVYCASSNHVEARYVQAAETMGRLLAEGGHTLLYGGGNVGLMGAMARAAHRHGGAVVGVIPEALRAIEGVAYEAADELHITDTMQQRKHLLFTRADAFVVLPGGFGTLEEFMEVLTLKALSYHEKPIVLVNTDDFYAPLLALCRHFYDTRFARVETEALFHIVPDPAAALAYLAAYAPAPVPPDDRAPHVSS